MLPTQVSGTARQSASAPGPAVIGTLWLRLLLTVFAVLTVLCCIPLGGRILPMAVVLSMLPLLVLMWINLSSLLRRRWLLRGTLFFWLLYPTAIQWAFGGCEEGLVVVSVALLTPLLGTMALPDQEECRFWQALHSAMMTLGALAEGVFVSPGALTITIGTYGTLLVLNWALSLGLERIAHQTLQAVEKARVLNEQLLDTQYSLSEADKVKSDFLASMSHEIRTPMHAISGMADMLLLSDQLGPTEHMQAENIKLASQNLLGLINDILDISKIDAGKMELYEDRYDFPTMFHDVVSIIGMRAQEKGLAFLTQVDPDIPKEMIGDSQRIRQVLLNLLGNAVKFTQQGWVLLEAQRLYQDNQLQLRFAVTDTGNGIRPEDISRLFAAFEQLDSTRRQNQHGTGLGLAISNKLVELMRGRLDVASEFGGGTTFSFAIPQQMVDDAPIAGVPDAREKRLLICSDNRALCENAIEMAARLKVKAVRGLPAQATGFTHMLVDLSAEAAYTWVRQPTPPGCQRALLIEPGSTLTAYIRMNDRLLFSPLHVIALSALLNDALSGKAATPARQVRECIFQTTDARVLLIDDNEVGSLVAANLMALFGLQVDKASSGNQGITLLENTAYDIVFVDHIMPDMDGIETIRTIRAMGGRFAQQPILMLSANVMPESHRAFLAAGASDTLAKPIELPRLSKLLSTYLPEGKRLDIQSPGAQNSFLQTRLQQLHQALRPLALAKAAQLLVTGDIERIDQYLMDAQSAAAALAPYLAALRDVVPRITRYHTLGRPLRTLHALLDQVGEARLATRAKLLAEALANGELGFARENLPFFVTELGAFHTDLQEALTASSLASIRRTPEELLLERLIQEARESRYTDATQSLADLRDTAAYLAQEQLATLFDALQTFDYRAVEREATALLQKLTTPVQETQEEPPSSVQDAPQAQADTAITDSEVLPHV
ncbi:MAG: response regulator [Oscillospiraceae bacterium]|jgi:signal transduction histidine kinase/DNA-binding response OmpR family regulator|nr:response regulator [Oscillospiraceae bacterium]